jgi:hypothetical protein
VAFIVAESDVGFAIRVEKLPITSDGGNSMRHSNCGGWPPRPWKSHPHLQEESIGTHVGRRLDVIRCPPQRQQTLSSPRSGKRYNGQSSLLQGKMGNADQKGEEIVFNIFRDTGDGNFLNRVCKDKATNVSQTGGNMLMCAGNQIHLQGRSQKRSRHHIQRKFGHCHCDSGQGRRHGDQNDGVWPNTFPEAHPQLVLPPDIL